MPINPSALQRLKLRDLRMLRAIASTGSMVAAAEQLGVTQSAVSKAIGEMEATLGIRLVERVPNGTELTAAGAILVQRAGVIFDELAEGFRELVHLADPSQGEIRIGTTEPNTEILAWMIQRVTGSHPRIQFKVMISDSDTLIAELRNRRLDVAITRWASGPGDDDLACATLFAAPLMVMADRRHPILRRRTVGLAELIDQPWTLSPPDTFLGQIVAQVFRAQGLALPHTTVTSVSIAMRLAMMANGRFLSVLPRTMLYHRTNRAWLRAVAVPLGGSTGDIALVSLRKRQPSATTRLFTDVAQKVGAEIGGILAENEASTRL